jgi:uncharacterized protein
MSNPSFRQFVGGLAFGFRICFWLCALIYLPCAKVAFAAEVQPGFDCNKATTATEKLICQDRDLRWADHTMADAYQFRLKALSPDARQVLVDDQKEWLVRRAKACGTSIDMHEKTYCLLDVYQKRNQVLLGKFWLGWSPSPEELATKLKDSALEKDRQGICPVSREFGLDYYLHMAADQREWSSPIFFEIPQGMKAEEVKRDYVPIGAIPERLVPSIHAPFYNQINPFHIGYGPSNAGIKIYCRVQDADGVWWLAHKSHGHGTFTYFLPSDMKPAPSGK